MNCLRFIFSYELIALEIVVIDTQECHKCCCIDEPSVPEEIFLIEEAPPY